MLTPAAIGFLTSLLISQPVSGSEPEPDASGSPQVTRLGGEPEAEIEQLEGKEGPLYRAGVAATDTKLPVGYPRPTPPGAIEIKNYPTIRQAEFSGSSEARDPSRSGFMPLFRHISSNNIAMTAPVEMRYSDTDGDAETDQWTMAFLYHVPENGPTGTDGDVEIVDTEPLTVVSIGLRGGRDFQSLTEATETLEAWIAESGEWERSGDLRQLGYNGPYTPIANRWWEVQIPIARVDEAG